MDKPTRNLHEWKDFEKLKTEAQKRGAKSLDYSKCKNYKYFVTLENDVKIHFGNRKYEDYLIHKDRERREKYLNRAKKIVNKKELTYNNPKLANYWSYYLLWYGDKD